MKKTTIKPVYTTRTQRAYIEAWEVCMEMKRLESQGRKNEIIEDVLKQLRIVQKQRFYKLAAEFAICLHHHYSNIERDETKAKKYYELSLNFTELSYIENIVKLKFSSLSKELNSTRTPDDKLIDRLRDTCNEFKSYLNHESALVRVAAYKLINKLDYIEGRFEQVIKQSYEVINYFEGNGIDRSALFYKDTVPALIRCGQYDEASNALEKSMSKINKGKTVWSALIYYQVVMELHRKNYKQAYDIFKRAEKGRHIHKDMMETWMFVRGYIKFLIEAGRIEGSTHFKLGKFLNSIEVFSKDKDGQKINAVILKVLLRLQSDREQIIEDREKVERYSIRYFKKESRARIFFNMLHQIVAGNFQKKQVAAKAAKYLKRLPKQKGYNPDLEIVPYADLWGMVVEGLD